MQRFFLMKVPMNEENPFEILDAAGISTIIAILDVISLA